MTQSRSATGDDPQQIASSLRVVSVGACLLVAIALGFSLWQAFAFRVPIPFWDMIAVERYIEDQSQLGWSLHGLVAITQNEHRPVFPLLLWIADHSWFASTGITVLVVQVSLLAVMTALLMRWMRGVTQPGFRRVALMTATPLVLFWPAQGQNLTWSVQLNSLLSLFTLLMAIAALLAAGRASEVLERRPRSLGWLALAIALVFVSTFSLTFGLLGWPLLLGTLLVQRRPWWMIAPFAIAGLATVAFYVAMWVDVPHHAHALASLAQPFDVAAYFFALLGAPAHKLIEWPFFRRRMELRGVIGVAIFVLVVGAALRVFLRDRATGATRDSQADAPLVLVALLGLGCAFVIALGRHNFGVAQSLESRYTIIPCFVWLGTAGYWLPRLAATLRFTVTGYATACALAIAMTASYLGHAASSREFAARARIAAMTEVAGITHPQLSPRLHKDDASRQWLFDSLRRRGHPFFAEPWSAWMGRPVAEALGTSIEGRCHGRIEATSRLGDEIVQLTGWAWDPETGAPPPLVVAVDQAGVVRGLGATGIQRIDVFRYFGRLDVLSSGWIAAARTKDAHVDVIAVTMDGRACNLSAAPGHLVRD